ncbi:MAG: hypothetical protein Q4P24_17045 [Rhodobacterales bacterium]|nr:hypothetical protein [Rhodobacterales bacterium]
MIEPHLKPVTLTAAEVLEQANTRVNSVYFLISGIGSTVTYGKNGHYAEVGLFGFEGMSGLSVIMHGEQSPQETFMQHVSSDIRIWPGGDMKNWPTFSLIQLWFQMPQRTLQKPAAAFFAAAVAVTSDRDDMAMVKQAIEDRRCDDNIAEDGTPFTDGAVRGYQHRIALVTPRDESEEQMRRVGLQWQVAEFVQISSLGLRSASVAPLGGSRSAPLLGSPPVPSRR